MHVLVACPILWMREDLTSRLVSSISKSTHRPVSLHFEWGDKGYVATANKIAAKTGADAVLYSSDDQEFYPDCIEKAILALVEYFPDTDGMIGIRQEHGGTVYGIRLLGRKFIERFPGKAAECPDYIGYFGDEEVCLFAKSIKRFHYCREAVAVHHMPKDETRQTMQKTWEKDRQTWNIRRHLGLLWGRDFDLINA